MTTINNGKIAKRVPKDATNKFGIIDTNAIPIDEPCIVIIGGGKSVTQRHANYYASIINKLFKIYGVDGVGIYSAYKSYAEQDRNGTRVKIFRMAQSLVKRHFDITDDTEYFRDLYNQIILPRIVAADGTRFSPDVAMKNMRRVMLFTHCHGAAIVRVFQELMYTDMVKYGYDKKTIAQIMRQLLVIQHAPIAPLIRDMFNTVSFMSADDPYTDVNYRNKFVEYVASNPADMEPSYFQLGNLFAAPAFTNKNMSFEHQIVGLVPTEEQEILTPYGKIIMSAERNAIINGARAVQNAAPTPGVRELVAPASPNDEIKPDFDELKQNGEWFMAVMRHDLQSQRSNEH
jgi:hypothetical protein